MFDSVGGQKAASSTVKIERSGSTFLLRQRQGAMAHKSTDPNTERVWWDEIGVNQNLCFPVQPDPVSGMHCWHQKVTVSPTRPGDRYGDIFVDTAASRRVYQEWKAKTTPAPGPGGLRRPLWLNRPLKPTADAYRFDS